jgi:hypothetical protein
MFLANFTLGDLIWSIFVFFMFVIWFWLLISIFGDLFRDHELSGVAKALWTLFILILPFLGILLYLVIRGGGMAERAIKAQQEAQKQAQQWAQQTVAASGGSPADQIAQAKSLLDSGAISQAEFDQMKSQALGS